MKSFKHILAVAFFLASISFGSFSDAQVLGGGIYNPGGGSGGGPTTIPVPTSQGGTGATALGVDFTNAGSVLNPVSPQPRVVTGTTDTVLVGDAFTGINYKNTSPMAVTIPDPTTTGFTSPYTVKLINSGTSTVTVTPAAGSIFIYGATNSNISIAPHSAIILKSNGSTGYDLDPSSGISSFFFAPNGDQSSVLLGQAAGASQSGTNLDNVFIGNAAGNRTTTGSSDVYIGQQSGLFNITGQGNTCGGTLSCFSGPTTGFNGMTAWGNQALKSAAGSNDTAIGNIACLNLGTGVNDTCLGPVTGNTLSTGSSDILIGYNADVPSASTSNYLNIGNFFVADTSKGIININGPAASTPTSCGGSPTISSGSTDISGTVTEGTVATGCVIPFKNTHTVVPNCVVMSQTGLTFSYTVSTTAITITNIGALSSTNISYNCLGYGLTP